MRWSHLDGEEERSSVLLAFSQEIDAKFGPNLGFKCFDWNGLFRITKVLAIEVIVIDFICGPKFKSLAPRPRWYPTRHSWPSVQVPLSDKPGSIPSVT